MAANVASRPGASADMSQRAAGGAAADPHDEGAAWLWSAPSAAARPSIAELRVGAPESTADIDCEETLLRRGLQDLVDRADREGAVVLGSDELLRIITDADNAPLRGADDGEGALAPGAVVSASTAKNSDTGPDLELDIEPSEKQQNLRSPSAGKGVSTTSTTGDEDSDGDESDEDESGGSSQSLDELASLAGIDLAGSLHRDYDRWIQVPERYRLREDEKARYFLYQPSGGWGNQRLILRWAIIAANALNRTLVLPPVAPHANFYTGFNRFNASQLLHMGQVLDLDALASRVHAGIRVHQGDMRAYESQILSKQTWRTYEKPAAISFLQEKTIHRRWAKEEADVVYWHKTSMWKCCATMDAQYYAYIQYGMDFAKTLQAVALQAAAPMAPRYNAIHFRRGDSQIMERRNIHKYVKFHRAAMRYMNKSLPLYIATDERDRALFKPLTTTYGFSRLVFPEDLAENVMRPFMAQVPAAMRGDVLGFIDQIICLYAERWSGSALSTFSYVISAMRNKRLRRGKYFTKVQQLGGEERFLPRDPARLV